jgi:hypothetical protein
VSLHPDGMAPRIVNFREWSGHLLRRLLCRLVMTADEDLERLRAELVGYPGVDGDEGRSDVSTAVDIALPLQLRWGERKLAFLSTVTVFGTALDITIAELAVEAFYPANGETARALAAHSNPIR